MINYNIIDLNEYKTKGQYLEIRYGVHPSPFGPVVIGVESRGICSLEFLPDGCKDKPAELIGKSWILAKLTEDQTGTRPYIDRLFSNSGREDHVTLLLKGTNFQIEVWKALLAIPRGKFVSYEDVARSLASNATRAVANAIARNPLAYIIPCHRVINKNGNIGGYAWGVDRKAALINWDLQGTNSIGTMKA